MGNFCYVSSQNSDYASHINHNHGRNQFGGYFSNTGNTTENNDRDQYNQYKTGDQVTAHMCVSGNPSLGNIDTVS